MSYRFTMENGQLISRLVDRDDQPTMAERLYDVGTRLRLYRSADGSFTTARSIAVQFA